MTVQGVNQLGAYYPDYLKNKRKAGAFIGMTAGLTGLSTAAMYINKHSFAVKNPKLMLGVAIASTVLSLLGIGGAAKAQKELNIHNARVMDTRV